MKLVTYKGRPAWGTGEVILEDETHAEVRWLRADPSYGRTTIEEKDCLEPSDEVDSESNDASRNRFA